MKLGKALTSNCQSTCCLLGFDHHVGPRSNPFFPSHSVTRTESPSPGLLSTETACPAGILHFPTGKSSRFPFDVQVPRATRSNSQSAVKPIDVVTVARPSRSANFAEADLAMDENLVPPVNIRFNPITQIGSLKWVVKFTYPNMGYQNGFDNHSHLCFDRLIVEF